MGKTKIYYTKDILKLELAERLGYQEKLQKGDWGALTSVESGRLGGLVCSYMRKHQWMLEHPSNLL